MTKRVQDLEKRIGTEENRTLMRITFVGCRADSTGPDRPIHYPVTGFRTMDLNGPRWDLRPGEGEEQLWERAKAEVEYSAHGVACLLQCYAEEEAAQA